MFNKRSATNPLGVPLGELAAALEPTSIRARLEGNTLVARHEHFTVRVEVVPPENRESDNGPIRAVVRVRSDLPGPFQDLLQRDMALGSAVFNKYAALAALHTEGGRVEIGSRLTIFERDSAWETLHLPLLLMTIVAATEALLGGIRRTFTEEEPREEKSRWTDANLAQVERYLSRMSVCTTGGLGLTAEFGLAQGQISAAAGHRQTALFRLLADQPHPEMGGGLVCLLEMPHDLGSEERVATVCQQLNTMEMAAHDLPPHFGAWCPGGRETNPAYVSFLPNGLHGVPGIAVNFSIWALHRAQWAHAMLASMGARV